MSDPLTLAPFRRRYHMQKDEEELRAIADAPITPSKAVAYGLPVPQGHPVSLADGVVVPSPSASPAKKKKRGPKPVLSEEEEASIIAWVDQLRAQHYPVTLQTLADIANCHYEITLQDGSTRVLTREWARMFVKRWSQPGALGPTRTWKPVVEARANWGTSDNLRKHYDAVQTRLTELGLGKVMTDATFVVTRPDRLVSFDESSVSDSINTGQNSRRSSKTFTSAAFSDEGRVLAKHEQIKATIVVGTKANGEILPPLFIWPPGVNFTPKALDAFSSIAGCRHVYSDSGGNSGFDITRSFFNMVCRDMSPTAENPIVVTMDGVSQHLDSALLLELQDRHVHCILRVPHTSHLTQPEDLHFFLGFKSKLRKCLSRTFLARDERSCDRLADFASSLASAWTDMDPHTVQKAWEMGVSFRRKRLILLFDHFGKPLLTFCF